MNTKPDFGMIAHDIVRDMCKTWHHGFGLLSPDEQEAIRRDMEQLVFHDVLPRILSAYKSGMMRAAEIVADHQNNGKLFSESYRGGYETACYDIAETLCNEVNTLKVES